MHLYNFHEVQIIWDQSGFIELCVTLKRHLPACQFITKVRDPEDTDRATWVITPVTTGQSSWTWADPRKALNVLLWSSETESMACHSAGLLRQPSGGPAQSHQAGRASPCRRRLDCPVHRQLREGLEPEKKRENSITFLLCKCSKLLMSSDPLFFKAYLSSYKLLLFNSCCHNKNMPQAWEHWGA